MIPGLFRVGNETRTGRRSSPVEPRPSAGDGAQTDAPAAALNPIRGRGACRRRWSLRLKGAFDMVLAVVLLLALAPLLALAAVAIRLDSTGPILFRQVRIGKDGRPFVLLKLRTMVVDNDAAQHESYVAALIRGTAERHDGMFKLTRDPRLTRVGRVLRRLSVDELPQLWNVLRGEMSIVGPRPALPAEVALFDARARERLRVRPGLTGLAQVSGRCELSFREMVELDLHYVDAWSWRLELQILLCTPRAVLSCRGAS